MLAITTVAALLTARREPDARAHAGSLRGSTEDPANVNRQPVSDQLERWLTSDEPKSLGSLIDAFGTGSFALLFIVLLSPSALPLPTGGATHVFEVVAMLLALQLIIGRREVWLPTRWQRVELNGKSREKFITVLLGRLRWLERFSRPRWHGLFGRPLIAPIFGLVTFAFTLTSFLAPPFSGLDTLPSLAVVLPGLSVLMGDVVLALAGLVTGVAGVALTTFLGNLAARAVGELF